MRTVQSQVADKVAIYPMLIMFFMTFAVVMITYGLKIGFSQTVSDFIGFFFLACVSFTIYRMIRYISSKSFLEFLQQAHVDEKREIASRQTRS